MVRSNALIAMMFLSLVSTTFLVLFHLGQDDSPDQVVAKIHMAEVDSLEKRIDSLEKSFDETRGALQKIPALKDRHTQLEALLRKITKDDSDLHEKVVSLLDKKLQDVDAETPKTADNTGKNDGALKLSQNNQPFFDDRPVSFTHIPKCSGTSFRKEIEPEFAEQNCYSAMRKDSTMNVVFMRSTRKHVQSQHGECYFDDWGKVRTNNTKFPRSGNATADYISWLEHFSKLQPTEFGKKVDFDCIDPRDTSTRHMSCKNAPNPQANHALPSETNISLAISNLYDANFLGLTDFYHESICMLNFRRTRNLPSGCMCDDSIQNGTKTKKHHHLSHGVPTGYSGQIFPQHVLSMIDSLTQLDRVLFEEALQRFVRDLKEVEKIANQTILCEKSKEILDHLLN